MTTPLLAAQSLDKLKAAASRPMIGKKVTKTYQKKGVTFVEESSVAVTGLEVGVGGAVAVAYVLAMYYMEHNPLATILGGVGGFVGAVGKSINPEKHKIVPGSWEDKFWKRELEWQ